MISVGCGSIGFAKIRGRSQWPGWPLARGRTGARPQVIDSQSVKTTENGGPRVFDAGKKIKGRKSHIVTDTEGHLVGSRVMLPISKIATARSVTTACPATLTAPSRACGPANTGRRRVARWRSRPIPTAGHTRSRASSSQNRCRCSNRSRRCRPSRSPLPPRRTG